MDRRTFIKTSLGALAQSAGSLSKGEVMTVLGAIPAHRMGTSLIHEHLLVDFIGADAITPDRWNKATVRKLVKPYIDQAKARGVTSFFDCTPAFLGRDPMLLREIAHENQLNILTNTGYYGAANNKYLPPWAYTETAPQLATRWIQEFEKGIEGTGVRPGFIKIGVNAGHLSELHTKLIQAAGLTHLATGLTICSHTGPALPAFEQIKTLEAMGVSPEAFVWVHAQNEPDKNNYIRAARLGAWVSLDGMGWGEAGPYAEWLGSLKTQGYLHKVLISHDAGWYRPGDPDPMAHFKGFTHFFDTVWPLLTAKGFTEQDRQQLLELNPMEAFRIRLRKSS